jgi:D-galactose 1-dehydrogenase
MSQAKQPIAIAIIGPGKIARDQHVPAIRANPRFNLVASVSNGPGLENLPVFATIAELVQVGPRVDAVALCTPPQVRGPIAHAAIDAGLHVLLEKPPAATLGEFEAIKSHANRCGVTVFATWHSRFAPMVEAARTWLGDHKIRSARITWRENVRKWHPGQHWLWQPGGLGVFDPGINALSILTRICSDPVTVLGAELDIPRNCQAPIGARLSMMMNDAAISADFDFRQTGQDIWDIEIETTDDHRLALSCGGSRLSIDGAPAHSAPETEYPKIYQYFATLIDSRNSDCDITPLRLVADAFLIARTVATDPFEP